MTEREKTNEEPGFGAAMRELEAILSRVEAQEIDIDLLATELKRAHELLELCRSKIRKAELEVNQIVARLDADRPEEG